MYLTGYVKLVELSTLLQFTTKNYPWKLIWNNLYCHVFAADGPSWGHSIQCDAPGPYLKHPWKLSTLKYAPCSVYYAIHSIHSTHFSLCTKNFTL